MAKRPADCDSSTSSVPFKRVQFEPIRIGPISTLEEMDIKVLQFQNKKLAQVGQWNIKLSQWNFKFYNDKCCSKLC